jgi:hypothetical protein
MLPNPVFCFEREGLFDKLSISNACIYCEQEKENFMSVPSLGENGAQKSTCKMQTESVAPTKDGRCCI